MGQSPSCYCAILLASGGDGPMTEESVPQRGAIMASCGDIQTMGQSASCRYTIIVNTELPAPQQEPRRTRSSHVSTHGLTKSSVRTEDQIHRGLKANPPNVKLPTQTREGWVIQCADARTNKEQREAGG
jgi:hypothetical protein